MKLNYILLNALVLGSTPLNALGTGNGKFGKSESHPPHVLSITISSNQPQPDNSLIGATISVVDTGTMQSLYDGTWQGSEIKVNISPLINVRVTVGEVEGYATPAEQTFETATQGERNLSFVYNACLVTVNATTNQSEHTDVAGSQITVAYDSVQKIISSGGSVKVPLGKSYTVTASDIQYYQTPSAQQLTAETASKDVSVVYNTCVLTVNVTGVDFADNKATITYDSVVQTAANGASVKVPYGKNIAVSFPEIDQYSKPIDEEFVASEPNKTVTANYVASGLLLHINSNQSDKADLASVRANVSWEGSDGVTIGDGETIGIPTGKVITITFPEVEGYKKPDNIVFTHNGGLAEKSGLYQTEVVTVTVNTDNSVSCNGQQVTINNEQHTYAGIPISVKIPFGTSYTVSVNEKSGFTTPAQRQFTANRVSRSVTMTYLEKKRGIFILDTDGNLVKRSEWSTSNNSKAVGVAVLSGNCKFVIAPTQYSYKFKWSKNGHRYAVPGVTTTTSNSTAKKDYKGVSNSSAIVSKYGAGTDYAAGWCQNFSFKNGKKGYLGSCGEWQEAYNNKAEIDACMSLIGGTAIATYDYHWTSTQYDSGSAWKLTWSDGGVGNDPKGNDNRVRAFAAL